MTTDFYFVSAIDVLMLRGNRSFGEAGEHGEAIVPPWPSLFAGAFRSALLGGDTQLLAGFTAVGRTKFANEDQRDERMHDVLGPTLFAALGTPQRPGHFRITWASLAMRHGDAAQPVLPLFADLVAHEAGGVTHINPLAPALLPPGLRGSALLPMAAILRTARQVKPANGHWLDIDGLAAHMRGQEPAATLRTDALYQRETRLGIALDAGSRTASDGALYTSEAITLQADAGFLVGIAGARMPGDEGLLRLGGDGRGARWRRVNFTPPVAPDVAQGGRFRLLLTTPGIFGEGWMPEGVIRTSNGDFRLSGVGFGARLACAAAPRHEVVSGWDLAQWAPKTAQRVVSAGSVYWFDDFAGDVGKLAAWVADGIWPDNASMPAATAQRRAEGFNNALLGQWPIHPVE
jgi:CRISPR-associated protein Cmr3